MLSCFKLCALEDVAAQREPLLNSIDLRQHSPSQPVNTDETNLVADFMTTNLQQVLSQLLANGRYTDVASQLDALELRVRSWPSDLLGFTRVHCRYI